MTVEIGVLSKCGVALASDSAVTIGNGETYYNTANKLFSLSKYHPVAIMVYNNSKFMECPMEIIIKEYRKVLGEKEFDTVLDYWNDFVNFLQEFINEQKVNQEENLKYQLDCYLSSINIEIEKEINDYGNENNNASEDEVETRIKSMIKCKIHKLEREMKEIADDSNFTETDLNNIKDNINESIKFIVGSGLEPELQKVLLNICIMQITKKSVLPNYTGIVICGYGKKEIYPSIVYSKFMGCYYHKVKMSDCKVYTIDDYNEAEIFPFGQDDVINTFIDGIDSNYKEIIKDTISKSKVFMHVPNDPDIHINTIMKEIEVKISEYSKENYRDKIIQTISSAPKEELVNMAETLVNLTSFRRKIIIDNNSHTVGGPIDVALITKGDGLIWIKRKNYFDKELNPQFFHNYYK